jgi:hypothetical protein
MLWEWATAPNVKREAIRLLVIFLTKHGWNWFKIQLNEVTNGNISLQAEQRVAVLATVFRLLNHGPHHEEHIARRIVAWLQDDLQSRHPAVINREVVPRWQQRTDISVAAPLRSGNETLVPKVIIEIKGNWNPDVQIACGTQLVNAYLRNQVDAAGIYLVVWFGAGHLPGEDNPRSNRLRSQDLSSAHAEITELVALQRDAYTVQGFVLDCTL